MVSKFTSLSSILLAPVALAIPSSLVEASFARGHEERHSQPTNHVALRADATSDLLYAPERMRAGGVIHGHNLTSITGTITIPVMLSHHRPSYIGVWISFDGFDCPINFQVGLDLGYRCDGSPHHAAYAWLTTTTGRKLIHINGFPINPGDEIMAWINIFTGDSVSLSLRNMMFPNQQPFRYVYVLGNGEEFCQGDVAWLLQAYEGFPFPSYRQVTFKDPFWYSSTTSSSGYYDTINIQNANGKNITDIATTVAHSGITINIINLEETLRN